MENWKSLDFYITLDQKNQKKKEELTRELITTCLTGNIDAIKKVLLKGVYVNNHDNSQTALMACVDNELYEVAEFLFNLGASPTMSVMDTDAIWLSLKQQKYDFLELFYSKKYKGNPTSEEKETPLIFATKNSDLKAVNIIAFKVDVNKKDIKGNTALHYNLAIQEPTPDDIEIGRILIMCGADTNAPNEEGLTPKDMATSEAANSLIEKQDLMAMVENNNEAEFSNDDMSFTDEPAFDIESTPTFEETPQEPKKKKTFKI